MGAAIKIAVSFLAHIRAEIGAFKYKGRDFLGSNPLLLLIPLGQERKGRAGHLIESFLPPTTCCLSEKLAAAPFITCLVPSHAPTSLHLSRLPTVHKLLPSLTARAFSLCLHLNSLVFIRIHHLYFLPWEALWVLYDSSSQRNPGPVASAHLGTRWKFKLWPSPFSNQPPPGLPSQTLWAWAQQSEL